MGKKNHHGKGSKSNKKIDNDRVPVLWTRIQIRIGSDLHHFYGSGSVSIPSSVVDPHHLDADQDSTDHPDADPELTFHPDADPDPSIKKRLKKRLKKVLKLVHTVHFGLPPAN
jgi:hypothetical protein